MSVCPVKKLPFLWGKDPGGGVVFSGMKKKQCKGQIEEPWDMARIISIDYGSFFTVVNKVASLIVPVAINCWKVDLG